MPVKLTTFWKYLKVGLILVILLNIGLYFYEDAYFSKLNRILFSNSPKSLTNNQKILLANAWIYKNLHQVRYEQYRFPKRQLLYLYYRLSPTLASISGLMTAEYGTSPHTGPCGSLSRVLKIVLEGEGIKTRRFLISDNEDITKPTNAGHTMLEVQMKNGRYAVFDPTFNLFWQKKDGSFATKEELHQDQTLFESGLQRAGMDLSSYPYRFVSNYYMRWERLPFGVYIAMFLRDTLHVNINNFPGFQIYDRANLFLAFICSLFLGIIFLYENLKQRYVNGIGWTNGLAVFEIAFIVCVIPAFFSFQLSKNEHFAISYLILVNMLPGMIISVLSFVLIFKKAARFLLLLLLLLFYSLNLIVYLLTDSRLIVILAGNIPNMSLLLYLRYLKQTPVERDRLISLLSPKGKIS